MVDKALVKQIQETTSQVTELQEDKFLAQEDGENTEEIERHLEELQSLLEGLKEEYNAQMRSFQNMDLGKLLDEKKEAARSITVDIEGISNAWLESMCYAAICQALQFRWSSTVQYVEDARTRAALSPENTQAQEWYERIEARKEEMEILWIAAEQKYKETCEYIEGEVSPPKLYIKSHQQALHDARIWYENRQRASKSAREKLVAVQNDMDAQWQELFTNALPAREIY